MADPMTAGALVATALAAGAEIAAGELIKEGAKDIYGALKAKVAQWAASDVDALETQVADGNPVEGRKAAIAEVVDARPEAERSEVAVLAEKLIAALGEQAGGPGNEVTVTGGGIANLGTNVVHGDQAGRDIVKGTPSRSRKT